MKNKHILIVDDHPTNRKLLRAILEANEHVTDEASDGVEALRVLEREPVDAIISDILMPRMDGYQLCHEVRRNEKFRNIPFIVYSGSYTSPADEKLALDFGADKFLRKPSPSNLILECVKAALADAAPRCAKAVEPPAELAVMKEYSARLVAKLEERNAELAEQTEGLQKSEAFKSAILESALDCIITINAEGKIVEFNPSAERTFGFNRDEAVDRGMAELIIPLSLRDRHRKALAHYLATGQASVLGKRLEMTAMRRDGTEFPIELTVTRVGHDAPPMFAAFLRDITQRKQAEAAIHRLNEELEQRVIERTAQLEAANQELESFSYSASHDLRAPLRHIAGYAELLRENSGASLDENNRGHLAKIVASAQRMGRLIDDLLAFSKIGRSELRKTLVSPDDLVRQALFDLRAETEGRQIVWKIAPLPPVHGDPSLLRQVVFNLVSNAVKYTRHSAPAEIEIGSIPDETGVVFFVRDNGAGFSMTHAGKLFTVFHRLHRVDEFEGTGIGLANVRRIINRHGGRVWAEGEVGKGATFYFSLPKSLKGECDERTQADPGR